MKVPLARCVSPLSLPAVEPAGRSILRALILGCIWLGLALWTSPAAAQAPGWLFPDRTLLPHLLAGPRDPVVKGMLVYADPNPARYGPGPSGEVAIAGTVTLARLWGAGPERALVLGMEGAAFAHFSFEVITRELVNTDWIFAVPLVLRLDGHWLRVGYYHTSSHLGDEYQRRYGPSSINFARDGFDLTLYLRPGGPLRPLGLGLYGGGLLSVNSHPEAEDLWRLRGGVELDPSRGRPWRPYAAVDVEREEDGSHGWRATAQLGLWLLPVNGRLLRLAVEFMEGPSAMGQFTDRRTRRLGLGLFWNP